MRAIHTRALALKLVFSVAVAKPQHCTARCDVGREPQGKAFPSNSSNQPKLSRIGYVKFCNRNLPYRSRVVCSCEGVPIRIGEKGSAPRQDLHLRGFMKKIRQVFVILFLLRR